MILFSFDIDGTLEIGCGPIPISYLWVIKSHGHRLITGSDWPICLQEANLPPGLFDKFCTKSTISLGKHIYAYCNEFIHVGDTWDDVEAAKDAGFKFLLPHQIAGIIL